jgi:virginiamycin B lyase
MRANVLGRLDPTTGAVKEYKLPTDNSGPHGIVADTAGRIWYTGNYSGLIGRLDPASGQVTEYKMPDPKARDPHTLVFDRAGMLWFTVQGGNFVGRLDPNSGKIDLVTAPTADSRPYGIVVNSRGVPFFDLFNTNKLGSIDPSSLAIREYSLPAAGARPRRIAIGRDDSVYYTDFARGMIGRLDPATGRVTEVPSPGGATSQPYGMAVTADGAVWFSESGVQPNTLVRLDAATGGMQAWPIPSGGGVVRHMVAAPNGDLWLACSGVDRIARARWTVKK